MAESIIQYGYHEEELIEMLLSKLRLQDNMKHIIVVSSIASIGNLIILPFKVHPDPPPPPKPTLCSVPMQNFVT